MRKGPGIEIGEESLTEGWWPKDDKRYLIQRKIRNDGRVTFLTSFVDNTKSKKANNHQRVFYEYQILPPFKGKDQTPAIFN